MESKVRLLSRLGKRDKARKIRNQLLEVKRMKCIIYAALLVTCLASVVQATVQIPYKIVYEGEKYWLNTPVANPDLPLDTLGSEKLSEVRSSLPGGGPGSTACRRGYVAWWKVDGGVLYLTKLPSYFHHRSEDREPGDLEELFPDRYEDGRVKADWFCGELVLHEEGRHWSEPTHELEFSEGKIPLDKDIPDAGWESIFFESIREVTEKSDITSLHEKRVDAGDLELRLWAGFGKEFMQGIIIWRENGSWNARHLKPVFAKDKPVQWEIKDLELSGFWPQLWDEMVELGILDLPDESEVPDWRPVLDGRSYVVEYQKEGGYRTYKHGNPARQTASEARKLCKILMLLDRELSTSLYQPPGTFPEYVEDGQVVLMRKGEAYCAFRLREQRREEENDSRRKAEVEWVYRDDGESELFGEGVTSGEHKIEGRRLHIGFGPFSVRWSFRSTGMGYIYYPDQHSERVGESDRQYVAITDRTEFDGLDAGDEKWDFQAAFIEFSVHDENINSLPDMESAELPTPDTAVRAVLQEIISKPDDGLSAMHSPSAKLTFMLGFDVPGFGEQGDRVWQVHITGLGGSPTMRIAWVNAEDGTVMFLMENENDSPKAETEEEGSSDERIGNTRAFLSAARSEIDRFNLAIVYSDNPRRGIWFITFPVIAGFMLENAVLIDAGQAHRILNYFADSGLLDRAKATRPESEPDAWKAILGAGKKAVYWNLGSGPSAPLEHGKLMGLGEVLEGQAHEAWGRFVDRLK